MVMNKTLIDIFDRLKNTKYEDFYQINEKAGTEEEISKTFKELSSRVNTSAFIFFSKKVLVPISEKIQTVPESKLLASSDGRIIVLLLSAFAPTLKNILNGNLKSHFEIDKFIVFESLFDMDYIKQIKVELEEDMIKHVHVFNEWIHWLIYDYDTEKSSEEKLFKAASDFAVKVKNHKSIKELEKASEPLLELYNSKEGNAAFWRNKRKKYGFPDKTEELYLSIVKMLVILDVIYSCGFDME